MIRVVIPYHLTTLARTTGEIQIDPGDDETIGGVLTALERSYPALKGTIRDYGTLKRRPFIRYFACKEDVSLKGNDFPLPQEIRDGEEPLLIIGSIAGG